jgi:hypothetical protein
LIICSSSLVDWSSSFMVSSSSLVDWSSSLLVSSSSLVDWSSSLVVHYPRSTGEFQAWFRADEDCPDYLEWLRWPGGFTCPSCGHAGVPIPATFLVVLHVPAAGGKVLPRILGRAGLLPASAAADGEVPLRSHVYVAPPACLTTARIPQRPEVPELIAGGREPRIDHLDG